MMIRRALPAAPCTVDDVYVNDSIESYKEER